MFTGLVQATGRITGWERSANYVSLRVTSLGLNMSGILRGDSIAVSGVCLTITAVQDDSLHMDISPETLARSTLGHLRHGDEVNLETALTPTSKLGGHLVTGHVDGIGDVIGREPLGASVRLTLTAPRGLARYIAEKGSICVDGVSMTVNGVEGATFNVNVIPHTLRITTLKNCVRGTHVNLEVDLIARYLERLLVGERAAHPNKADINHEFLVRHGFLNSESGSDSVG
jgi:riboflavin synthase